jgi:hypothetical protein
MKDIETIQAVLIRIKQKYETEGFMILGIFGSYARGEADEKSDVDVLYRVDPIAFKKSPGLEFFGLFARVKEDLEAELGVPVDLADIDALGPVGKKYILPEAVYVTA